MLGHLERSLPSRVHALEQERVTVRRGENCRQWALQPQVTHAGAKFRTEGGDCSLGGRRVFLESSAEGWGTSGGSGRGARPRRDVTVNSERDYGEAELDRCGEDPGAHRWRHMEKLLALSDCG